MASRGLRCARGCRMSDQKADQERVKHARPRERRVVRMPDGPGDAHQPEELTAAP